MSNYHIFKHLHTINKHRWLVFVHCFRVGIPLQGLVHDLSKYSFTEFFISARNYSGVRSPIANERSEEYGYSKAFIHHTRKNKHHYEYWVDVTLGDIILSPMPFKYALESSMDMIAASKVYNHNNFTKDKPLEFLEKVKQRSLMHSATKEFIEYILIEYKNTGFKTLKKRRLKKKYEEILKQHLPTEIIKVYSRENKFDIVSYEQYMSEKK